MDLPTKLKEYNTLIQDDITLLVNGAKLGKRKEEKPRLTQLRNELKQVLAKVASNGDCTAYNWQHLRNFMIDCVREVLQRYQALYHDSATFEEQEEIILQYLVFFAKPPFTLQRIAQLIIDTGRYYKSSRKLLYAFQKLVNVCQPQQ